MGDIHLLEVAKAKFRSIEYYIKIFFDEKTNEYSVYANNTNFNWGYNRIFKTKEEAEVDFYHTINLFDRLNWKVEGK